MGGGGPFFVILCCRACLPKVWRHFGKSYGVSTDISFVAERKTENGECAEMDALVGVLNY